MACILFEENIVSFASLNLHANIMKAVSACGFDKPTPIQAQSIPSILEGKDLVASAQTGTGKTAAFMLPALHRLSGQPAKKPRILVLTPTRELATQITKAAHDFGKFLKFNIVNLVGGMPYHSQIRELTRGVDIIVATPGRLIDHIEQKRVDLSGIEMLVLDEADRMSDMGFIDDIQYIAKLTPGNRQTLFFSATIDKQLTAVVRHLLKNPVRIDLSEQSVASPQIKQELYKVNNQQQKTRFLKHFLNDANIYKAIIFTATKISADRIADQLSDEGFPAAALHGDLRQNVRNRTVDQLRRGKIQFLVATDVAARGIDISDITHVINYDMPRFCEDYVHRIGRTGRAGKSGTAISFVLPTDMRHLQRIERFIGQRLKMVHQLDLSESASAPREKVAREDAMPFHDEQPREYSKKPSHGRREYANRDHYQERRGSRSDRDGGRHSEKSASDHYHDRKEAKRGKSFGEKRFAKPNTDFSKRSEKPEGSHFERKEAKSSKPFGERRSIKSDGDFGKRPERSGERRFEKSDRDFGKRTERSGEKRFEKSDRDFSKRTERSGEKRFEKSDRDFGKRTEKTGDGYFARKEAKRSKSFGERRSIKSDRDFNKRPKKASGERRVQDSGE